MSIYFLKIQAVLLFVSNILKAILSDLLFLRMLIPFLYLGILAAVAWADGHTRTIPDFFSLAILVLGVAALWLFPEHGLADRLAGLIIIALPMLLLTLLFRRGFGGGDIKLMAASGFLLGWRAMLSATFFGLIAAAVFCVWQLLLGKMNRKSAFPLGPFLVIGLMIEMLL